MTSSRKSFTSIIAGILILSAASLRAESPDKYKKAHEPFTAYGMRVRMSIVNPINKTWEKEIQPIVFQEIAPCRLASTRIPDQYDRPWGGPSYQPNESRHYPSRGKLETVTFIDPCSESVPDEAIGIVGRFMVTPGDGDGEVHIDPNEPASPDATTVLKFRKGEVLTFEAGVMFGQDGNFGVATWSAGADVVIDVLGYLLPDPQANGGGAKGDKGDQGDKGDKGEKGDAGATGAQGEKGDKGDTGATGANGAQGLKGDKGDTGANGAQGEKGDKGDTGATGATGAQGEKGEKGDKGDTGATGATGAQGEKGDKGDKGDTGLAGPKGDHGDTGAKGDKGDKGDTGALGPMGPMGPQGPVGPASLTAVKGNACYPPGNNAHAELRVNDGSITWGSIIILNYTDDGSNGNALALTGQGMGYFTTTGSPNKCFQYVVLNAAH